MPRWVVIFLCSALFALLAAFALSMTARRTAGTVSVDVPPRSSTVSIDVPTPTPADAARPAPEAPPTPSPPSSPPAIAAPSRAVPTAPVRTRAAPPTVAQGENAATGVAMQVPPRAEAFPPVAEPVQIPPTPAPVPPTPVPAPPAPAPAAMRPAAAASPASRIVETVSPGTRPARDAVPAVAAGEPRRPRGVVGSEAVREALRDVRPR